MIPDTYHSCSIDPTELVAEVLIAASPAEFVQLGADVIEDEWKRRPDGATILATGWTPIPVYRELALRFRRGELTAPTCPIVQLDEYVSVGDDDPRSLFGWFDREFLTPLEISEARVIRFLGTAADLAEECTRYAAAVEAAGSLNLAVLGLGPNGHVGFNEPPSGPDASTRVVPLAPESIVSNARYWEGADVPVAGITAGLDVLLRAHVVLLVVAGAHKREILKKCLSSPESPDRPASYLRRVPRLVVLADTEAWGEPPAAKGAVATTPGI